MNLRSAISFSTLLALSTTLLGSGPSSDPTGLTSTFSVTEKTQIPGDVLKPGQYAIHVVDHLPDRVLLRIDSPTSDQHDIFLAVPATALPGAAGPGMLSWQSGPNKTPAFRGYSFSSGPTLEFVYPKAEAAQLAKLNSAKVVAVDPASEGLPKLHNLTEDEMREINLWSLSLTTTGVDRKTPAILAQKFQAPTPVDQPVVARVPAAQPIQPRQTQIARLEQPQLNQPARFVQPRTPQARTRRRAPVIATLPHTGSNLPLIGLVGFFSLFAAYVLRLTRASGKMELL